MEVMRDTKGHYEQPIAMQRDIRYMLYINKDCTEGGWEGAYVTVFVFWSRGKHVAESGKKIVTCYVTDLKKQCMTWHELSRQLITSEGYR